MQPPISLDPPPPHGARFFPGRACVTLGYVYFVGAECTQVPDALLRKVSPCAAFGSSLSLSAVSIYIYRITGDGKS